MNNIFQKITNFFVWGAAAGLLAYLLSILTGISPSLIVGVSIAVVSFIDTLCSKDFSLNKITFYEVLTILMVASAAGIIFKITSK